MKNNLQVLGNNKQVTITSVELVDLINQFRIEEDKDNYKPKQHNTLMRDIRNEIEKGCDEKYFIKSTYINSQNKQQPCYILSKLGVSRLLNSSRITKDLAQTIEYLKSIDMYSNIVEIVDNRKEIEFLDQLEQTLKPFGIKGKTQYVVGKYRIDYYIENMNVAIEYDENDHKGYSYEKHELRQQKIEEQLGCKFIRVSDCKTHAYNVGVVIKELFNI